AELKAELEGHLRVLLASLSQSPGGPGSTPPGGTTPAGGGSPPAALPDLVPTLAAATATVSDIIVHDAVRNQGPADAGPFAVTFYLSRDAVLDGTDIPFCSRTVPGLKGGGTGAAAAVSEARTTCAWPPGATGSYHVIVVIDAANAVREALETNNQRATPAIRKP
ncbi:MAG TPA: CARDB domain-containing protein, partial [Candidatus Binatia bacterium]|nr:CARDB domain-containing protein [Candidatus Binatia bacterium]